MTTIALVGSAALIDSCAPQGVETVRFPEGAAPNAAHPDVIVAFEPSPREREIVDRAGLPTLMWWEGELPADVDAPLPNQRLVASASSDERLWRSVPLPVADELFADPSAAAAAPAGAAWLGALSPRREAYLRYFGDEGAGPREADSAAAIAVNLHDDERPACEHRALRALAQGRLLVSETLAPSRGLEPGIDYLEARDFDDLFLCVEAALRAPSPFRRVRLRGRRKAELFRASRVVPRLVGDLMLELQAR